MRIDVVAPLELASEDVQAWRTLQGVRPEFENPFLSPDWARAAASVSGPDRRNGRVLVVRDEAGAGVGFLPVRAGLFAALPIGAPMADYQALVAAPGVTVDPVELVRALRIPRLDFNHLLDGQPAFEPFVQGRACSQIIDISAGYEAYAAERRAGGHEILKDTAKKQRKLEREQDGIRFTAQSASQADFDTLLDWKRAQYRTTRQTDIFDAGWPLELLSGLFARPEPEFGGVLFTLHAGDKLIAAHFALRSRTVLHAWFIAHDAEFARYSPGVILIDHILRWASGAGVREVDLGPGDYRFKLQFANAVRNVTHGFVGVPSPASLVRGAQYQVRNAAESLPLGRVSALPGKAMRRLDLWRGLR